MTLPPPVDRFYSELWNRRDRSHIDEILDPNVRFRGSLGAIRTGHAAFWRYVEEVTGSFSEYRCDEIQTVVEGDRVFARMRFGGRHTGDLRGFAPTGEHVSWEGAALFELSGGRIVDVWVLGDLAGLDAVLSSHERRRASGADGLRE